MTIIEFKLKHEYIIVKKLYTIPTYFFEEDLKEESEPHKTIFHVKSKLKSYEKCQNCGGNLNFYYFEIFKKLKEANLLRSGERMLCCACFDQLGGNFR